MSQPPAKKDFVSRYSGAAAFVMFAGALHGMGAPEDVCYIFAYLPAVLLALAGYGTMRVQTAIVVQFVAMGIWWGLRQDCPGPLGLPANYLWPLLGAIAGMKLSRFVTLWPEWLTHYRETTFWPVQAREDFWFAGLGAIAIGLSVGLGSLVQNTTPLGWAFAGLVFVWTVTRFLKLWSQRIVQFRDAGAWPAQTKQDFLAYGFASIAAGGLAVLSGGRTLNEEVTQSLGGSPYASALIFFVLIFLAFAAAAFLAQHLVTYWQARSATTEATGGEADATVTKPVTKTEPMTVSAAMRSAAPFFASLGLIALVAGISFETIFVFSIAPAAFCVLLGHPLAALLTELVLLAIWLVRRLDGSPEPAGSYDPILLLYVGAAAAMIVLYNLIVLAIHRRQPAHPQAEAKPKDAKLTLGKVGSAKNP